MGDDALSVVSEIDFALDAAATRDEVRTTRTRARGNVMLASRFAALAGDWGDATCLLVGFALSHHENHPRATPSSATWVTSCVRAAVLADMCPIVQHRIG